MGHNIKILHIASRLLVPAWLTKINQKHLDDFEMFWRYRTQSTQEEESYWNWDTKNRIYLSNDNYEGYAIECEQITQGMILLETQNHRSWVKRENRLVYVQILETAPWNRRSFQPVPTFKLVGTMLLKFAQLRSEELGYRGLVGLHSLPKSESFYRQMQMIDCGEDEEKEKLTYFEWYKTESSHEPRD